MKAAAPVLDDAGLAFVTVASNPDLGRQGWKSFHRLIANDDTQAGEVARYIAEVLEARAVSVVHDNTEYGKGLAVLTKAALQERGVAVQIAVIDPKALDYSASCEHRQSTPALQLSSTAATTQRPVDWSSSCGMQA